MVATLYFVFSATSRRRVGSSTILRCASRSTTRGISKAGEPRSPTFSRTGPSVGIMTLVASRQFAPTFAAAGKLIRLPR